MLSYDLRVSPNDGVPMERAKDFPPVYQYLKNGPSNRAVLELLGNTDHVFRSFFYQTAHWRPEIGQLAGHDTPASAMIKSSLDGFPDESGLNVLRISPTMTLVVHLDQFDEATRKKWENANLEKYGFRRQGLFGNALVWERTGSPPASSSHLRIVNYDIASSEHLLTLYFSAENSGPWSHPELGIDQLTVRATYTNGTIREVKVPFTLPPFIIENETAAVEIPLAKLPSRAIAKLEISGRWVLSSSLTASPLQTAATSLDPDAILLAKLSMIDGISDGMRLSKSVTIPVRVKVENTGKALWLSPASTTALQKSVGYVSVGLLWFKRADVQNIQFATGKAAIHDGRIPILCNMPPSAVATLSHAITVPDQPGEYTVFLEMVSDGVCWFTDKHASGVLRYNVVVE